MNKLKIQHYSEFKKLALNGDIVVFYNKKNLFSKLINFFSKIILIIRNSKQKLTIIKIICLFNLMKKNKQIALSHVAICLGNGAIFEANILKGVHVGNIDTYLNSKHSIYILRIKDFPNLKKERLRNIVLDILFQNKGYDLKGLFALGWACLIGKDLNKIKQNDNNYFCSTLNDEVFDEINIELFPNIPRNQLTPPDYYNLKDSLCSLIGFYE